MFCSIQSILKIRSGDELNCYLFVKVYNAYEPLQIVSNIVKVNEGAEIYDLIPFDHVRSFAISIVRGRDSFINPMPNSSEID